MNMRTVACLCMCIRCSYAPSVKCWSFWCGKFWKYLSLRPVFPIVVKFLESGSGVRLSILPVISSHVQIQPFKFGEWAFSSENFPRTFSPDLMMDMSTGQTPLFNTSMPVCNVEAPAALGTFCFHRLHILLFRIS